MNTYIVTGYRTAVGKAPKGSLRYTRPDTMAVAVLQKIMQENPQIDPELIDDVIVGNAMPEAEQGLNMARFISLAGLNTDKVPGVTINRYCASGVEAIAMASAKIHAGMADCIIAGGAESMSYVPMGGYKPSPEYSIAKTHSDYYWGMGLTAEEVAREYKISREDQDEFAYNSHQKALNALEQNFFDDQIVPLELSLETVVDNKRQTQVSKFEQDEGPRSDTSLEKLAKLRPVFDTQGTVTAGNSSQTSDGAAFVMVVSESFLSEHNLSPKLKMHSYATAGVPPRIMGIGPIYAIPKALKMADIKLADIDFIELNEAFASQSLAVVRELDIDPSRLNINGGAIALGHPLGCTGAKLTVQIMHELKRHDKKYGMVTMCVGTGQGAAAIFENLQ